MSVFTRLRKSLRLDSNHADVDIPPPLPSPASFISGNANGNSDLLVTQSEKDSMSWLQAQYIHPPLKADKQYTLPHIAPDGDDQAVDIIYINPNDSPRKTPQPRGTDSTGRSTPNSANRRTSLMSPPTSGSHPSTSGSASLPVTGQVVKRKRSATVGHEAPPHVS